MGRLGYFFPSDSAFCELTFLWMYEYFLLLTLYFARTHYLANLARL